MEVGREVLESWKGTSGEDHILANFWKCRQRGEPRFKDCYPACHDTFLSKFAVVFAVARPSSLLPQRKLPSAG